MNFVTGLYPVHAGQKADVDCDYKVIAQIVVVKMFLDSKSSKESAQQVTPYKPLPYDILSLNLYMA